MSNLKNASLDDLKRELDEREKIEFDKRNTPPELLDDPSFAALEEYAREIVAHVQEHGYSPKDCKEYVFEMVMDTMAGPSRKEFWKWWNWRVHGARY